MATLKNNLICKSAELMDMKYHNLHPSGWKRASRSLLHGVRKTVTKGIQLAWLPDTKQVQRKFSNCRLYVDFD